MSLLKLNRKHGPRERAQAIVEFAIALPILMFMLVGIIEVGRLIYAYAAVINASREGPVMHLPWDMPMGQPTRNSSTARASGRWLKRRPFPGALLIRKL